jgi:hypothetical protein
MFGRRGRVPRYHFLSALVAAALFGSASSVFAQSLSGAYAFPPAVQEAMQRTSWLIDDIYDEAPCYAFSAVRLSVTVELAKLNALIDSSAGGTEAVAAMRRIRDDLNEAFAGYSTYCAGSGAIAFRFQPLVDASAISQNVTGEVQRLARDLGGTIRYDFGNERLNASGAGFDIGARIPLGWSGNYRYFGQIKYSFASLSGSGSGSATGPFNIPGLGVGANPNGFATGAPGAVTHQYELEYRKHGFEISGGLKLNQGAFVFTPIVGARFGYSTLDDSYDFSRPAPPNTITGLYTTNSTVNSYGAFIGLGVEYRPTASRWSMFALGRVGFDFNSATSDVAFDLTSPLTESQRVSIEDSKTTPFLALETGLQTRWGPVTGYIKGAIEYGNYIPNVAIPGGGALPTLTGETATEYKVTAGLRLNFMSPPPPPPP